MKQRQATETSEDVAREKASIQRAVSWTIYFLKTSDRNLMQTRQNVNTW